MKKSGIFVESGRDSIRAGSKSKSKARDGKAVKASPGVVHVSNCPNDEGSWAADRIVPGVSPVVVHSCDQRSGDRKSESRPVVPVVVVERGSC